MGMSDDAIQSEAWLEEVWSKGSKRSDEGIYAAPHYGYLDAAGGQQDIQRATNARTLITRVPQGKAYGRYQGSSVHKWPKEDSALPTVSTESTFVTATIAAAEKRKVRCYDGPSAFVNTEVDEDVIMVLKGVLADMMVQIAPEVYRKYIKQTRRARGYST